MRPTNLCAKCIFMKWPCAISTINMYFCVKDSSLREFFIIFYPFPDIRFSESRFSSMTAQGVTNRTAMQCRFRESFDIYSPLQAFTINRSQLGFCTSYNSKPSELTRSRRAQKHWYSAHSAPSWRTAEEITQWAITAAALLVNCLFHFSISLILWSSIYAHTLSCMDDRLFRWTKQ